MPQQRSPEVKRRTRVPQLGIPWEKRSEALRSSILALLHGPAPPQGWPLGPFFKLSWVQTKIPRKTLTLSALFHVFVFVVPFPAWLESKPQPVQAKDRYQLTYYGPVRDLPPLAPPSPAKKSPPAPAGEPNKPLPQKGADAFHPRQIVLSTPPRPTHPRQTLIQPSAPPEAPKILPDLPNIVQWDSTVKLQRPRLHFDARLKKPRREAATTTEIAAPEIRNTEQTPGALNIAASPAVVPKPKLALNASAVPRLGTRESAGEAGSAPDVAPEPLTAGDGSGQRVIALSATPAPPAPQLEIPPGNLAARISISPEGRQPGSPGGDSGGAANGSGDAGGGSGGTNGGGKGSAGPEGIIISGGSPENRGNISGTGSGIGRGQPGNSRGLEGLPDRPIARLPRLDMGGEARSRSNPAFEKYVPGAPPEVVLGPKRIYTLNVNMPNINSASGSWILHFAELDEHGKRVLPDGTPVFPKPITDLLAPVPLRKVDPKYPPMLASAKVQGEVVLYAIIRRDGTVDSIQLVKGVEPTLDANAMSALAKWKFRPAERQGNAVELEALVYIPFRIATPY
jgi:protein TonB